MLRFAHCIIAVITPATTIIMIIKRMPLDIGILHDESPWNYTQKAAAEPGIGAGRLRIGPIRSESVDSIRIGSGIARGARLQADVEMDAASRRDLDAARIVAEARFADAEIVLPGGNGDEPDPGVQEVAVQRDLGGAGIDVQPNQAVGGNGRRRGKAIRSGRGWPAEGKRQGGRGSQGQERAMLWIRDGAKARKLDHLAEL
jgi:hypothetical protein